MSLTKSPVVTIIPGAPGVPARAYSKTCAPESPPVLTGVGGVSAHGAAVSTYTSTVLQESNYDAPPVVELEVCTVYADGYVECVIQSP